MDRIKNIPIINIMQSEDRVLKALARSWFEARWMPYGAEHFKKSIILPAILARMEELDKLKKAA